MIFDINTAEQVTEEVTEQLTFIEKMTDEIQSGLLTFSMKAVFAAIVFVIGAVLIHFIRKAVHKALALAEDKNGFRNGYFVEQVVKFLLYLVLILIIAQYFGVSATSVVAILGSAGLTLGLGFQGALSNFAGGVLLLIHKPFTIGDYLVIQDLNYEGKVKKIGMIYTELEYQDLKKIIVPNGALANTTINNLSTGSTRILEIIVSVAYSADIARAKSLMANIAEEDPGVHTDRGVRVYVSELGESSVNLGLRICTDVDGCASTRCRLLEKIKYTFDENGIEIPFNQLDVHLDTLSQN